MDQTIIIIVGVFLSVIIATLIADFLIRKRHSKQLDNLNIEDKIMRLSQDALKNNNEQFLVLAKEVLGAEKGNIKIDLEGKKSQISSLIEEIRKDIKKNEERLAKSDDDRIRSFSSLKSELEEYKKISGDLKMSTDKLKSLLSNNQMRGAFGEQIAENLLKMAGFVIGQDYSANKTQETEATRPDFTIYLPDKTKINIDVKFPYNSLIKSIESENDEDKKKHFSQFKQDVKQKIKQVSTRDYINPAEKTVDFVILFVPNEMIFSYIYDKMNDIWEDAMRKKVILAGPFSFTAILRMVKQAYTNFRYQENLHQIISQIQTFDKEYQKFSESLDALGERIKSVDRQFDTVSTTRDKQLTKIVDKIKDQNIEEITMAESPNEIKIIKD
jgi:DNA recombination protein RmuC